MLSFVEASNHELSFDKALLSKVEGLRANENLANGQSRFIIAEGAVFVNPSKKPIKVGADF